MSTLLLSRLQFTFTMGYHILWPAFTIGLAWFIVFSRRRLAQDR
ncbi:MAG: cytochrome ubiquinol oxidase subunit I [Bradyrhizobium sp.]